MKLEKEKHDENKNTKIDSGRFAGLSQHGLANPWWRNSNEKHL